MKNDNLYWVVRGVAPEPPRRALPLDPAKRAAAIQGMAVSLWIPIVAYSLLNYHLLS